MCIRDRLRSADTESKKQNLVNTYLTKLTDNITIDNGCVDSKSCLQFCATLVKEALDNVEPQLMFKLHQISIKRGGVEQLAYAIDSIQKDSYDKLDDAVQGAPPGKGVEINNPNANPQSNKPQNATSKSPVSKGSVKP
eukprot:TRINITY_DN14183_c0_g1_i1.p1 TRINITY_DN14183_c0_g1~~TRINITY_DN14183_c0_g1_i1.p1  ORF type:complete len:138 (+),score=14.44 TRINITY_DN14183_c0_g1_i1:65-478(+)